MSTSSLLLWIAIIEGLTEFLPISSTAHMIFISFFFGSHKNEFVKLYQISIQFGAILAIVILYWKQIPAFRYYKFYVNLFVATIPILLLGKLFDNNIEKILEQPIPIAIVLIIGGIILLFIDNQNIIKNYKIYQVKNLTIKKVIIIGIWQSLAIIPGVSRSAISIIGGMQQGLSRSTALKFSFLLALPTIIAVTCYSIFFKNWNYQGEEQKGFEIIFSTQENIISFILGNIISFIIARMVVKFFIQIFNHFGFKIWGIYRIILGTIILIYSIYY